MSGRIGQKSGVGIGVEVVGRDAVTASARLELLEVAQRAHLVAVRALDRGERALEDCDPSERIAGGE